VVQRKDFEQDKKFYGESLGLKKTFEMVPCMIFFSGAFRTAKNRAEALKLEGAQRDALRCNMQCAVKSEFSGAAAERFFGGNARDVRIIVLLG
jgi:hypothetical protein